MVRAVVRTQLVLALGALGALWGLPACTEPNPRYRVRLELDGGVVDDVGGRMAGGSGGRGGMGLGGTGGADAAGGAGGAGLGGAPVDAAAEGGSGGPGGSGASSAGVDGGSLGGATVGTGGSASAGAGGTSAGGAGGTSAGGAGGTGAGGAGGTSVGGAGGSAGTGGTGAASIVRFDFEADTQGWQELRGGGVGLRQTTINARTGTGALAVDLTSSPYSSRYVGQYWPNLAGLAPATQVRMFVWLPGTHNLLGLQPFVTYRTVPGENARWFGEWRHVPTTTTAGAWNELPLAIPANAIEVLELGLQLQVDGRGWTGTVLIDSVAW